MTQAALNDAWEHTDPSARYEALTRLGEQAALVQGAAAALRARCLADFHAEGLSYERIAAITGLTKARVQQLVIRGRSVDPRAVLSSLSAPGGDRPSP